MRISDSLGRLHALQLARLSDEKYTHEVYMLQFYKRVYSHNFGKRVCSPYSELSLEASEEQEFLACVNLELQQFEFCLSSKVHAHDECSWRFRKSVLVLSSDCLDTNAMCVHTIKLCIIVEHGASHYFRASQRLKHVYRQNYETIAPPH